MMGDTGFVSVDDVRSVFIMALERLEKSYGPTRGGIPTDFKTIIEDIDDIRRQLLSRSQHNLAEYLKSHPETKREIREAKQELEVKKDTRDWKERVQANRAEALREALQEPSGS